MSRGAIALMVMVTMFGLGAIFVAREFKTTLSSPAGLRLASQERLRNLATALHAYREAHAAWPDSTLQLLRERKLALPAVAGVLYRKPAAAAPPDQVVLWREQLLPAVRRGESWAGPDKPAERDVPAVGHVVTVDLVFAVLTPEDFARRVPAAP